LAAFYQRIITSGSLTAEHYQRNSARWTGEEPKHKSTEWSESLL